MKKKLYIFRGLPGSGKSTLAHKMAAFVIEPDMFRYDGDMRYVFDSDMNREVMAHTLDLFKYAVRHLKLRSIAVAATHVKVEHMTAYVRLAKKSGYEVCVVECYDNYGNIHDVPAAVISRMAREFEPLDDEAAARLGVRVIRNKKK